MSDVARYHDGAMTPDEARAFEQRLEHDPALGAELAALQRTDDAIARALTRPIGPPRASSQRVGIAFLFASGLSLAALGIAAIMGRFTPTPRPIAPAAEQAIAPAPENALPNKSSDEPVEVAQVPTEPRWSAVVMIVPARSGGPMIGPASGPAPWMDGAPHLDAGPSLDDLLAAGDSAGAARHIAQAPSEQRARLAHAMARQMRSAQTLEAALRELSPADRLELCLLWMPDPRFRSTTMQLLGDLAHEPSIASEYEAALAGLWTDPSLRPWLTSYGLAPLARAD